MVRFGKKLRHCSATQLLVQVVSESLYFGEREPDNICLRLSAHHSWFEKDLLHSFCFIHSAGCVCCKSSFNKILEIDSSKFS